MKPKTEELLYLLLWGAEIARRPSFRNVSESFESWAYRSGFQRQLGRLEKKQLLEGRNDPGGGRLYRLTLAGRQLALGGHDPAACWHRAWDGKWRMILFDVPQSKATDRARLRRSLAERKFGYLQNSVWVTPDPLTSEADLLRAEKVDVESLILLEAYPCAGERDEEIVLGAWKFDAINESYEHYLQVLKGMPGNPPATEAAAKRLQNWFGQERQAWNHAISLDPLLPECLHPKGYLGFKAWHERQEMMGEAHRLMRLFKPGC